MSTPTMEQRLDDFHAMLKRAGRVHLAGQRTRGLLPDSEARPLILLSEEVANLCHVWHEAAHRAGTGALVPYTAGEVVKGALQVAARCLGVLADTVDLDTAQLMVEVSSTAMCHIGALTLGEDLALTRVDRVSRLLAGLGDVACYYDYPADDETAWRVLVEITELLAARAICAAVAADNGRWEVES